MRHDAVVFVCLSMLLQNVLCTIQNVLASVLQGYTRVGAQPGRV